MTTQGNLIITLYKPDGVCCAVRANKYHYVNTIHLAAIRSGIYRSNKVSKPLDQPYVIFVNKLSPNLD